MPSRSLLGRLPPLQSLGKACSVDFGDDSPFTESHDDSSPTPLDSSGTSRGAYDVSYGPEEAESTAAALCNCFRLVEPGSYVIKRSGRGYDDNDIRFIHSPRAVDLGRKHRDLQLLLTLRAHLHFLRDCAMRIQAVQSFTFYVQDIVKCELMTWHQICQDCVTCSIESRLDCLSAICEDLRVHVNHWRMTQQRHLTDKWLQQSSRLFKQIHHLRSVYSRLQSNTIWWVGQFISIGMRVLAHSDLGRITQCDLWQITKGIEEFNAIVSMSSNSMEFWRSHHALHRLHYPSSSSTKDSPLLFGPTKLCNDHLYLTHPYLTHLSMTSYMSAVMQPIPISYLLNILANERAKYAAAMVHRVITSNSQLRSMAYHSQHISFNWETLLSPDEKFTPSSATATPPLAATDVNHDVDKLDNVKTTPSNKRHQKRTAGNERRKVRPQSPIEGDSNNGKTSDYWSATTSSSGSCLPPQGHQWQPQSTSSVVMGGLLGGDGISAKSSSALNKASARISAGQASRINDAAKYCVQQLVSMARHEEDFASEFLTTISHCSTLMHKPSWQDSVPMQTLGKAGLVDVQSMLPQQIPLSSASSRKDISYADEDLDSDSTVLDSPNESTDFVPIQCQHYSSVLPPVEEQVLGQPHPLLSNPSSTENAPAVVIVQTSPSSSEAELQNQQEYSLQYPGKKGQWQHHLQVPGEASGSGSPGGKKKSVSWSDSADLSMKLQLCGHFMDMLWLNFAKHLYASLQELTWCQTSDDEQVLGHVTFLDDVITVTLSYTLSQLCSKELLPPGALLVLEKLSQQLLLSRASAAWDQLLSSALATSQTDKGHPTPLSVSQSLPHNLLRQVKDAGRKTRYGSTTGKKFRDAFQPLLASLSLVCSRLSDVGFNRLLRPSDDAAFSVQELADVLTLFSRLLITVGSSANWLCTKTASCLSSWSVSQFLLTTQSDLKTLTDCIRSVTALKQRLMLLLDNATPGYGGDRREKTEAGKRGQNGAVAHLSISPHLLIEFLQKLSVLLGSVSEKIQTLSSTAIRQFSSRCKTLSTEFFWESIPSAKFWRRKSTGIEAPTTQSKYIEEAVFSLLAPVIEGCNKLSPSSQISSISMTVTAVGEAWMDVFLKQKIRFSLYGAQQLQLDLQFFRNWLDQHLTAPEVRQSILSLDMMAYIKGVCICLMRQPAPGGNRKGIRFVQRPSRSFMIGLVPPHNSNLDVNVRNNGTSQQSLLGVGDATNAANPVSASDYGCSATDLTSFPISSSANEEFEATPDGDWLDGRRLGRDGCDWTDEDAIDSLPNAELWLDLRVIGGTRSWSLPNFPKLRCFSTGTQS